MNVAYYYAGNRTAHASVVICNLVNGTRHVVTEKLVSGRRDARAVAQSFDAKPWNF